MAYAGYCRTSAMLSMLEAFRKETDEDVLMSLIGALYELDSIAVHRNDLRQELSRFV